MNKDKKNPWNYNFLGRKEQPLSAHMKESGVIDGKTISKFAKEQVRLFKQNRKAFNKKMEENKRKSDEYNFQKKMRHIEKRQKQLNDERNRLMNSRVIDG